VSGERCGGVADELVTRGGDAGNKVSIVWVMVDSDAQRGDRAKLRFKEVAAEVLPDVEYLEVEDPDTEEDEPEVPAEAAAAPKEPSEVPAAPTEGDDEAEVQPVDDDDVEEEDEEEEEEEEAAGEADAELLSLQPTTDLLNRARAEQAEVMRRRVEALRWLADNPVPTETELAASRERPAPAAGSASTAAPEEEHLPFSARDKALRLCLLVTLICDKQAALAAERCAEQARRPAAATSSLALGRR
jgi:hypothetical protein